MDPLAGSPCSALGTVSGFAQCAPKPMLRKFAEREVKHCDSRRVLGIGCGEPFWFADFSGEPQCFLTDARLYSDVRRVDFATDPGVPVRENNLPTPGTLSTRKMHVYVIYEGPFRRKALLAASSSW